MCRFSLLLLTLLVAACPSEIYVRDGVTDGNRFYLGNQALDDHDPVLQSWVAYSLAKSVCQLEIGGNNPARNSSYGCEFFARRILLDTWQEMRADNPQLSDDYLNTLTKVRDAAYLDEYVVHYFGKNHWLIPAEIDAKSFHRWRRKHLNGHKPYTRLIGSWGYAEAQTDR